MKFIMPELRKSLVQSFTRAFGKVKSKWDSLDDNPEWLVPREDWGAKPPRDESDEPESEPLDHPASYVVIHDTPSFDDPGSDSTRIQQVLRDMQEEDMADDWTDDYDIVYNFMVGGDGKVYTGRGWNERGAHTHRYNHKSIGVALVGNHQDKPPAAAAVQATVRLIEWGMRRRYLKGDVQVVPHSALLKGARCPTLRLREAVERGDLAPDPRVAEWAWLWTVKRWLDLVPGAVADHVRGQIDFWIDEWKTCSTRQWFYYWWNN